MVREFLAEGPFGLGVEFKKKDPKSGYPTAAVIKDPRDPRSPANLISPIWQAIFTPRRS